MTRLINRRRVSAIPVVFSKTFEAVSLSIWRAREPAAHPDSRETSLRETTMSFDSATTAGTIQQPASRSGVSRLILATSIGNALEFYDLIVYGYFATVLSRTFFPVHDRTVSLLLTLGTFALSYLARPIGALVLGSFSDRKGRKASLTLSIAMMTLGTGMVALMPSYATIGLLAPIGIFASRLLQGFSAGGEFGSSTAFLIEHEPARKGFMASWQFSSQGASTLIASA